MAAEAAIKAPHTHSSKLSVKGPTVKIAETANVPDRALANSTAKPAEISGAEAEALREGETD